MTFLKKVGSYIVKGLQIIAQFEGVVTATVPGSGTVIQVISKDLTDIGNIIIQIEAAGQALGLPGAQKLTAATPAVAQVLLQSALLANHKVANEALFQSGAQKIADGMVDVLNSLKDDVATVDKAA